MSIVFESFTSGSLNNVSSGTLALPSGTSPSDVLVFVSNCDGNNGLNTLSGFTDLFGGPVTNTTGGSHRGGYQYRVCDGTEPSSYSITTISGNERTAFALLRFSGVDNVDPINASGNNPGGSNTSVVMPSSVTTTEDDCLVIGAISLESGNRGNPVVPTWPTDWTERYDNENGPPGNGSASSSCAAATFVQSVSGTLAAPTITVTGGNTRWISAYIALTPDGDTTDNLISDNIETSSETSSPLVGQVHSLSSISLQSNSGVSSPSVGVIEHLTADNISSLSEVSSVDCTVIVDLVASSVESLSELTPPDIGSIYNLTSDSIESQSGVSEPSIGLNITYELSAESVEATSKVSSPIVQQTPVSEFQYVQRALKLNPGVNV